MKITGLSSRIAAFSSPLPSAGVEAQATRRPGICRNIASKLCEWVGPARRPPPPGIRITIGTLAWPLNMYGIAAAWLMIWSKASSEKLTISSTIGRNPPIAEPTPQPTIVFSEIGVSRTRRSPNSSSSPSVTLNAPGRRRRPRPSRRRTRRAASPPPSRREAPLASGSPPSRPPQAPVAQARTQAITEARPRRRGPARSPAASSAAWIASAASRSSTADSPSRSLSRSPRACRPRRRARRRPPPPRRASSPRRRGVRASRSPGERVRCALVDRVPTPNLVADDIEAVIHRVERRLGGRVGELDRLEHAGVDPLAHPVAVGEIEDALRLEPAGEDLDRAPLFDLLLGPVDLGSPPPSGHGSDR